MGVELLRGLGVQKVVDDDKFARVARGKLCCEGGRFSR